MQPSCSGIECPQGFNQLNAPPFPLPFQVHIRAYGGLQVYFVYLHLRSFDFFSLLNNKI